MDFLRELPLGFLLLIVTAMVAVPCTGLPSCIWCQAKMEVVNLPYRHRLFECVLRGHSSLQFNLPLPRYLEVYLFCIDICPYIVYTVAPPNS